MRQIIRTIGKITFWPAIVIVGLNIENLASALGYDSIFTDAASGGGPLAGLWRGLTGEAVFYCALVMLGVGFAAWTDYFAKKWDGSHPTQKQQSINQSWPLKSLAFDLEGLQHDYGNGVPAHLFSQVVSRYETLRKLGFGTPSVPVTNRQEWAELNGAFCNLMWPLLEDGHVELAKSESKKWAAQVTKGPSDQLQLPEGTAA